MLVGLPACDRALSIEAEESPGPAPTSGARSPDGPAPPASQDGGEATPGEDWGRLARETHAFVVGNLLTPHGSVRTTPGEDRTDEWHDVSQLGADAAMIDLGDASFVPYATETAAFLDKLWDRSSPAGGYFATSAVDGTRVDTQAKYVDDNSLAGVTWLDARDSLASDQARSAAFLSSARSVANFLMQSGVWDSTYGGGFWWSTQKPDKPTQSNGLALQLFVRLSAITGEPYYGDWASSVLGWLETKMFDASKGLYSWKWEASGRNDAKFTYDQAIMIDAHLLLYAQKKDRAHLDRARAVADAMHTVLWDPENGGYVISTEDRRLSPVFSAWATCTLARLHDADNDAKWLDRAAKNLGALDAKLRDATTHGYYASSKPDGSERSATYQAVDQAWMQRAQAMLAKRR